LANSEFLKEPAKAEMLNVMDNTITATMIFIIYSSDYAPINKGLASALNL
jgi:hypothetical protein